MTPETDSRGNTVWAGSSASRAPLVSKYPPLWTMYWVEIICLVVAMAGTAGIFAGLFLLWVRS